MTYGTSSSAEERSTDQPESTDLIEFKARLHTEGLRYARNLGAEGHMRTFLSQLGVEAPATPEPTAAPVAEPMVRGTIIVPFAVTVREAFGRGVTADDARSRIQGYSMAHLAGYAERYVNRDEATVEYEVG